MDTKTVTLTEFLLARIAEDEAAARSATGSDPLLVVRAGAQADALKAKEEDAEGWPALVWAAQRLSDDVNRLLPRSLHDPARVLVDCAAKRRIVSLHPLTTDVVPVDTGPSPGCGCETCHTVTASSVFDIDYVEALGPCDTLCALALPYADHPDYDESWRP